MALSPIETKNVSLVGYHDLEGRPGFKMDVQRRGDLWYLYLSHFWHSGWSVLDVTDPQKPEYLCFIEGPDNTVTHDVQVADNVLIGSLEPPRMNWGPVDGDLLDPSKDFAEGISIFDVEDPENPDRVGGYSTGGEGTHRNFYAGGDLVYLSSQPAGFEGRILEIVDISNPVDPKQVSQWWWPGQSLEDDSSVVHSKFHHGFPYISSERAYLPYGRIGLVVLDIENRKEPEILTRLDFGGLGGWVGTHSTVPIPGTDLLIATNEPGLESRSDPWNYAFLVDLSDESTHQFDGKTPHGPQVIQALPTPLPQSHLPYSTYHQRGGRFGPHNVHYSRNDNDARLSTSDFLYMTYFNAGLRIFDISIPEAPREVGHFVPGNPSQRSGTRRPAADLVSHLEGIVVDSRGYIYCTDPNRGVVILESSFGG